MLTVSSICSCYGKSRILEDVSLSIGDGEVVTLLGRNGVGKTTTLKSIAGCAAGIWIRCLYGQRACGQTHLRDRPGGHFALVPENRGIFGMLSVEENAFHRHAPRPGT